MDPKVLQALEKFAEQLKSQFDSAGRINLELNAEYSKEQSYRLSSLYITLNVGILSASSFVLSNRELHNSSKIFVPFLLLSVFAIIIEACIRKLALKILDRDTWARMGHADRHNLRIGETLRQFIDDPIKCSDNFYAVAQSFNKDNDKQHMITARALRLPLLLRVVSEIFSILSILSLLLIAFSELGILQTVYQSYFK